MEDDDKIAYPDQPSQLLAADDARVVVDFTVGPPGIGPVIGFDSDDFFLRHQMRTSTATEPTDPLERALVK